MKKVIMAVLSLWSAACADSVSEAVSFEQMGREALTAIERDHAMPGGAGYFEDHTQKQVAFTWGNSMLLLAYAQAARQDKAYADRLDRLIGHMNRYWVEDRGIGGYDHLPHPKSPVERYYDDNAWVAMGLIDAYDAAGKEAYLQQAAKTIAFSLSGRDKDKGGIWWRESPQQTKNTCSVAPTAYACLRYYETTRQQEYLQTAKELMTWLDANLKDSDHLYFDCLSAEGHIERTKWSYNTGMPLQNYVKLFTLTGDRAYLDKAVQVAQAAEKCWVDSGTGAIKCESMFAWTLAEGWVNLSAASGDPHWRTLAANAASHVYRHVRDPQGRYPRRWDTSEGELKNWNLLYSASTARVFWFLAVADPGKIDK